MANEIVNPQITDSVTQANTKVLGDVPAFASGNLMQMASQSAGLSMQNAVTGQQQSNMLHQASTTQAVDTINRSTDYSKMIEALSVIKTLSDR